MSEKKFPILGTNESIDWNLIAPHEKQAMENHCGQTLEQLARRHGLSWYELLCVLLDKPFTEVEYDKEKNYKELCQRALVSEEVKQYREIGTPEECRAAMEKQKKKNPIRLDKCTCPYCGTYNEVLKKRRNILPSDVVHCWHCGHAIPWVDAQPTAYDPDKVVEQLEKVAFERYENDGMGGERVVNLDDVVEIVKGGVVDG